MFSSLAMKAGLTLLLITACLFFAWRIVKILNPRPPRPPKVHSYDVASVLTGNTIEVYRSKKHKRTIVVTLSGIGVPSLKEESRAHLEQLAGKQIRIEVSRRGLLRETKACDPIEGLASTEVCDFDEWMNTHKKTCERCRLAMDEGEGGICEEAFNKLQDILRKDCVEVVCKECAGSGKLTYPPGWGHKEPYIDDCWVCGGDGKVWRRDVRINPDDGELQITDKGYNSLAIRIEEATREIEVVKASPEYQDWLQEHLKSCQQCQRQVECGGVLYCKKHHDKFIELWDQQFPLKGFYAWFDKHCEECKICSSEPTPENPEPMLCEEAFAKLQECLDQDDLEFRGPVEGVVYGETGLCLQLEMLRAGYAISVGDVPKSWAKAEKTAKKAKRGIWQ